MLYVVITSWRVAISESSRVNGAFTATISASDCGCRDAISASPQLKDDPCCPSTRCLASKILPGRPRS
ncbi:hypothetical protein PUN28_012478 [Cardiocondyla obscurior]|uniref:Uncharacterized protein n=1 Tax=Cardiocondyla obscurior TaxID=286306 RepID=A0AAW2FFL4_9HYME